MGVEWGGEIIGEECGVCNIPGRLQSEGAQRIEYYLCLGGEGGWLGP